MKKQRKSVLTASLVVLALVAAACGGDSDSSSSTEGSTADTAADGTLADDGMTEEEMAAMDDEEMSDEEMADMDDEEMADEEMDDEEMAEMVPCDSPEPVSLQLQWVTQAQFAGYYAAQEQGFYAQNCLDVTILEGGVEIVPQVQLANGDADFAISWVPKALATREAGANITNIAQVFQRSGTLQVSFADSGITTPADFEGKTIGNWGFGNEYEVFAAIGQAGLDPATDVDLVGQQFDMVALLEGDIDAAEAMTYNEYAQVLEAENPDTGELYQPEDFNVINYEEIGVGMLQDAIWADGAKLVDDPDYRDQAVRFVAASLEGWTYCRDNAQECADLVIAQGSTLGASHQLWQMNEINKLIWPSENGAGFIDQAAWDRTVDVAITSPNLDGETLITEVPDDGAFNNDIVTEAWDVLAGMDIDLSGANFTPIVVTLLPGGE